MIITHDAIAERARRIWEKEGRPEGRDQQHWLQAEAELRQESGQNQPARMLHSEESPVMETTAGLKEKTSAPRRRSARRH